MVNSARRMTVIAVAAVVSIALVVAPAAAQIAVDDPAEVTEEAERTASTVTQTVEETKEATTEAVETQSSSVDSAPTGQQAEEEAQAAASSSGSVVDLDVLGEDVLTVSEATSSAGQSQSGRQSSDGSESHATLIAVLGQELWGAKANSEEGVSEREGLLLEITDEVCGGTSGQLCVSLLYEERNSSEEGNSEQKSIASACAGGSQEQASHDCDGPVSLTVGYAGAHAGENDNGSDSSSDTALVDACVGSDGHSASQTCDGPVSARVAESHSDSSSEKDSPNAGDQSAASGANNSTADICVGGESEETGTCEGAGVVILHSESASAADTTGRSENENDSHILAIEANGEEQLSISEEGSVALPPDCPDPSVVCLDLNQAASEAEAGKAGGAAQAVAAEVGKGVLGEDPILGGTVDESSSGVDVSREERVDEAEPDPDQPLRNRDPRPELAGGPEPAPRAGVLATTGSGLSLFVLMGAALILMGAFLRKRFGTTNV